METKHLLKGAEDQAIRAPDAGRKRKVLVARSEDLPEQGRLVVDIDNKLTIGIFRLDNQLYAYANACTHSGGPVCQGRILPGVVEVLDSAKTMHGQNWDTSDMHIVCPWHGYEYSIKTGRHAGDPSIRLRSFPIHEAQGDIYVEL
jgi:nitrite reductase/ring-hydroxylating ferredoxin subunit